MKKQYGSAQAKTVFILIGPKGSGKTHIGKVIEKRLGIPFLQVERLLIEYIEKHELHGIKLERDGFDIEEQAIRKRLETNQSIIFEATGSSIYFQSVIDNLGIDFKIKLIRILCPLTTCFERIKTRNSNDQFHVDNLTIDAINAKSAAVELPWDLEIDNSIMKTDQKIIEEFSKLTESPL